MTTPRRYTVQEALDLGLDEVLDLNRKYVNETLVDVISSYGLPRKFVAAEGIRLWDDRGREYLDFLCSYGALGLGHNNPDVIKAVEMARRPPNFFVIAPGALTGALASNLAVIAPGDLERSFFCNSGSEAIEGAMKLARAATGRKRFIAAEEGFHGKSLGALSATGHEPFKTPYRPLLPGVAHVPFADTDAIEDALRRGDVAAVILEPIQGPAGIIVPPAGYLQEVRKLCTAYGSLLVLDEIQTGLGRTGRMFACEHEDVVPDILCISKGLSGGIYPIGAYITTDRIWRKAYGTKKRATLHSSTFGGNSLACAAAIAAINLVVDQGLATRAAESGRYFRDRLQSVAERFAMLKEIRGRGLMLGLDFTQTSNPVTRAVRNQTAAMVAVQMLHRHNIISLYTFANPNVVRLAPPLDVSQTDLDAYVDGLEEVLGRNRTYARLALSTGVLIRRNRPGRSRK